MTEDPTRALRTPLPVQLISLVLRTWARRMNITPLRAAAIAATAGGMSAGGAVMVNRSDAVAQLRPLAPLVLVVAPLGVTLTAMLLAVVAGCAGADLTPAHRGLLTLPVSTRTLSLALATPGMIGAALVTGLSHPALVPVMGRLSGYGAMHACLVLAAATLIGVLAGRTLVVAVRAVTAHSPWLVQHVTTVAVGSWCVLASASVLLIRLRVSSGIADDLSLPAAFAGWPALLAASLRPRPIVWVAVTALAVVLCIGVFATATSRAGVGITRIPRSRAHHEWTADRPAPGVQLFIVRLLRNRRTLSWVINSTVILLALSFYLARVDETTAATIASNVILLVALLASYPILLARGLDRRHRPIPVLLGIRPTRYTLHWQVAATLIAILGASPPILLLVKATGDIDLLIAGVGYTMVAAIIAACYSSVTVPQPGDSSAEMTGGMVVLVVMMGVGLAASRIVGTTNVTIVAVVEVVFVLPFAALPAYVEQRRWRSDTCSRSI